MLVKGCAIWFLIGIAVAVDVHQWDVAVALKKQILLLDKNGTLLNNTEDIFNDIKAITYHYNNQEFIVADRNNDNDTIYVYDLNTMEVVPIVEDLSDDIQGIALDPVSNSVYWTDAMNKSINRKSLKDAVSSMDYEPLFDFQDQQPQDIAIDSCKRMIYWTNSNLETPTIEKSTIMGTDRQVLVKDDLFMPSGIAIDQLEQRVYWTDMRQGIYFRIESTDFDGNDRQVLHEGTHQKPFGLTIDKDYVHWTDINNNALWRKRKFSTEEPEIQRRFDGKPNGIIGRLMGFPETPNCDKLALLIKRKHQTKENEKMEIMHPNITSENKTTQICVHGALENGTCICQAGFTGAECDLNMCFNYCQNGKCEFSQTDNKPKCTCDKGYLGQRCEKNMCDNFCLNNGICNLANENSTPQCTCPQGFNGSRCETIVPVSNYEICRAACSNDSKDIIVRVKSSFICRCSDLSYMPIDISNGTETNESPLSSDFGELVNHPLFIVMLASNVVTLVVSFVLIVYNCKLKKMRPRIKKRVVVNKNVTPLTYRPQAVEQCEITIEDCCNMNICETPCFEPRNFQTKKDEKKTLLANMENNEEFY